MATRSQVSVTLASASTLPSRTRKRPCRGSPETSMSPSGSRTAPPSLSAPVGQSQNSSTTSRSLAPTPPRRRESPRPSKPLWVLSLCAQGRQGCLVGNEWPDQGPIRTSKGPPGVLERSSAAKRRSAKSHTGLAAELFCFATHQDMRKTAQLAA